jgi:hypothetical protein
MYILYVEYLDCSVSEYFASVRGSSLLFMFYHLYVYYYISCVIQDCSFRTPYILLRKCDVSDL